MKIKKVVIPVAGKGTRFLPATKEVPKELIPILTKPMIHYIVDEAVKAGIEQVIFVSSSGKHLIEDYFDRNLGLETFLESNDKIEQRDVCRAIGSMIEVVSVRQKEQLGLGHAINCAKHLVGDETFGVLLGDDMIISDKPVIQQLVEVSQEYDGSSVIGVMDVDREVTNKYGIIDGDVISEDKRVLLMKEMVEKPEPSKAPTTLATPGRYVLSPKIFKYLDEIPRGVGGEYQLTDAINMLAKNEKVYAYLFEGERYDTGSLPGYIKATVDFAMKDPDTRGFTKEVLEEALNRWG